MAQGEGYTGHEYQGTWFAGAVFTLLQRRQSSWSCVRCSKSSSFSTIAHFSSQNIVFLLLFTRKSPWLFTKPGNIFPSLWPSLSLPTMVSCGSSVTLLERPCTLHHTADPTVTVKTESVARLPGLNSQLCPFRYSLLCENAYYNSPPAPKSCWEE